MAASAKVGFAAYAPQDPNGFYTINLKVVGTAVHAQMRARIHVCGRHMARVAEYIDRGITPVTSKSCKAMLFRS